MRHFLRLWLPLLATTAILTLTPVALAQDAEHPPQQDEQQDLTSEPSSPTSDETATIVEEPTPTQEERQATLNDNTPTQNEDPPYEAFSEKAPSESSEDNAAKWQDSATLPSPTANSKEYEEIRRNRFNQRMIPKWSFGFILELHAFPSTEFRSPNKVITKDNQLASGEIPTFRGIHIFGDRMVTRGFGVLSVGVEGGIYSASPTSGYSNLLVGMMSAGAYAHYQLMIAERQPIIPFATLKYEAVQQNYSYASYDKNNDLSFLMRGDVGFLVGLNFLEPDASNSLYADFEVKRVYLSASFTYAKDMTQQNFDLSETNWRAGFRFEY